MRKLLSVLSSTLQGGVRGGLLFFALLATTCLWAYPFEVGGIYYNHLDGNNVEVRNPFNFEVYSGEVIIPSTVFYEGTTYNVTSIGDEAFYVCRSLTSITIPNSVTSIGNSAFYGCSSLTSITIPNSVTSIGSSAFYGCSSLTSITIPNSVTSIGYETFLGCSSLTSMVVESGNTIYDSRENCNAIIETATNTLIAGCKNTTIPNNVTSIGNSAFYGCSSLTSITIPNSVTSIGNSAFYGCSSLTSITIPNSVTSIGSSAFYGCSSLTSITIPNSVTSIGYETFLGCSSLTSITIPNSVTSIGSGAFYGCSSLTSITIPNSVTSIERYAFCDCSSLTSITIGNSVTSIGNGAFYGCSSLTSITIPNSVTSIGNGAFYGCSSLTSITIPNSVTSIGDKAFYKCYYLTSLTIGESVTSIGDEAFYKCYYLTSLTIGESVTSIGDKAFYNCRDLTSLTIGESVTNIGQDAFYGCSKIDSIIWNAKNCANFSKKENTPFYDCRSQIKSFTIGEAVEHIPAYLCYGMEKLTNIVLFNKTKTIGTSAFRGCVQLEKLTLGTAMENIGSYAFAGCDRMYHIYSYSTNPPVVDQSSFSNYNVYLHVLCDYKEEYDLDLVWGNFKYIECMGAESEPINPDTVIVIPGTNDVTITWPTEENAYHYIIEIKNDGVVFCTLTFNADGQLLNIAFAPSRNGNNHSAQYAEQAGNGYRFTVTGLTEATRYAYNITTKDAANQTIATYSSEFTTQSTTAVEEVEVSDNANVQKTIHDGQLLILRDGKTYNAMGQEM